MVRKYRIYYGVLSGLIKRPSLKTRAPDLGQTTSPAVEHNLRTIVLRIVVSIGYPQIFTFLQRHLLVNEGFD